MGRSYYTTVFRIIFSESHSAFSNTHTRGGILGAEATAEEPERRRTGLDGCVGGVGVGD
jgi:hypothetical protein